MNTPCVGHSAPYDKLTDTLGEHAQHELHEARNLCGSCPIMVACLARNAGEPWARAVLGRDHFETARDHHGMAA